MLKLRYIFLLIILVTGKGLTAQENQPAGYDFFSSDEVLHVTLGLDLKDFVKTKNQPDNYDAVFSIYEKNDTLIQFIKVKARGEMRRKYCSFPPVTLKFKKAPNLKLVTHCKNSEMFENYVFKEYLAYKLYNLVTPYSLRTRLVKIDYIDTKNPERIISAYGFLIENDDRMALRNRAMVLDNDNIAQKYMNEREMARVSVFNYMIGNTDWSVLNQHNIKILKSTENFSDEGIPVAYDFDYSGFVNTVYSAPAKDLPIKTVSERYYLGNCMPEENLEPIIEEFEALKPKFLETIRNFELLPENSKKKLDYYINNFYKGFRNQDILISQLNRTCRRP